MCSSLMLRRFFCFNAASSSSVAAVSSSTSKKKSLVFLGSPQVSATVLDALFNASAAPSSSFEVAAIVTQPPSRRERGRKMMPSPVAQYALDRGFPSDLIFTPQRAGEEAFLSSLTTLQPELCITAAYGNILPTRFLNIPSLGTVNIHPSLLPLYRGAAPVQRALQDGVKGTGVSLAFTVRALDAGPVIARERLEVDDQIKAPDLLALLFSEGSKLLISKLPSIFDGSAKVHAEPQDDSKATLAPKITPEESWLSFDDEALVLHNKVRAFAGWPGTRAKIFVVNDKSSSHNILELKIITTRVGPADNIQGNDVNDIAFVKGALVFPCGGCTALEVLEVQLPGKKVITAAAFWNGLRGQKLKTL
ncbi:PREDICTED: methionyl-tRNA formyltransferase isoform X1 [Theobroma cacao]|uniref:Methionyl-tRNA formyltransferase, mitochondrial n=1 Tax=Theobroma cacao TaxID=3641 RepID=A0AB32W8Z4_THECC|nr:PREDICTED: methionyl-tRNA formyltransferase isoform X1 [Theobroma cacao]XP_017974131.1 PREDICTED: methionyl-tRNA formyltransferase isoform X1 [Theobroma cacao]